MRAGMKWTEPIAMTNANQLFRRVILHLARTREFPEGSFRHGYVFVAPLDANGRIDHDVWRAAPERCTIERFWGDENRRRGLLVRRAGGAGGATWGFDYDAETHADDEAGYRLGEHVFRVGEYVSIRDSDGETRTFRVSSVDAVAARPLPHTA